MIVVNMIRPRNQANRQSLIRTMITSLLLMLIPIHAVHALSPAASVASAGYDCNAAQGIRPLECEALVALYNSTGGPQWSTANNWLENDQPCSWHGVTCTDGFVTRFDLSGNNLSGRIPPRIGSLTLLQELYLENNHLTGNIPAQMDNLLNLKKLKLGSNQLTGPIPVGFENFRHLDYLGLEKNQLTGELPGWLGSMSFLHTLRLNDNQLGGVIPLELGNLPNLQYLYLDNNQLRGAISNRLTYLLELRVLSLSGNLLSGSIPPTINNLEHLEALDLAANQLSGSIPPALGDLRLLKEIILSENQLSGGIPPEMGELIALETLDLHGNRLSGAIPAQLGKIGSLLRLDLSQNLLSGGIPPALGDLSSLESLDLSLNRLGGDIPPEIASLHSLERLALSHNQLSGEIPPWIGTLANLQILDLSANRLEGNLPASLGSLTTLTALELSKNALSGEITPALSSLMDLSSLDLGYNMLEASHPALKAFLAVKDPDWEVTQTIAPAGIAARPLSPAAIHLDWQAISYTGDEGYYEVLYSSSAGGPYSPFSPVAITGDKLSSDIVLDNLPQDTVTYIVIRTHTLAHPDDGQHNDLSSPPSEEIAFASQMVSPADGGSLIVESGGTTTRIEVAAGAVSNETTLVYTESTYAAPNGFLLANVAFQLDAYQDTRRQDNFTFLLSVSIFLEYDAEALASLDEETLILRTHSDGSDHWLDAAATCAPRSAYTRNPVENWLHVNICHLSEYNLSGAYRNRLYLPFGR